MLVFPVAALGSLVEADRIVPLRTKQLESGGYNAANIFAAVWQHDVRWGGEPYAVPLGSPVLTLCYRKDLLEPIGKPPQTWDEYSALVKRLRESAPRAVMPTCEPLAGEWAAKTLLARAAAYAQHRNQFATLFDSETMRPRIASEPFVRALDDLIAAGAKDWTSLDPQAALQAVLEGRSAMALSWPTVTIKAAAIKAADATSGESAVGEISFAELPGSTEVFSAADRSWSERGDDASRVTLLGLAGRLAAVGKSCRNVPAATRLLAWLSGEELSVQLCPASASTTLFRRSHAAKPAPWLPAGSSSSASAAYADSVQAALTRDAWLSVPRLPGSDRYLAALAAAVRKAVAGEQPPQEALRAAAAEWEKITREIGLEAQRNAYLRSLGE